MRDGKTAVSVRGLTVNYGRTRVLERFDLDVEPGEFFVLLGPSGCGKSTLLSAIAGLVEVSAGEIAIGGRDVTMDEPKDRGVGMVFQSYALYPHMTVQGNLSFSLRVAGIAKGQITERVNNVAALLQLTPLLSRRPAELSGGQRQRVAIGRALVREVALFLFDEPLSNLDAKLRTELRTEIKRLHGELGATMIYVTHDQTEALMLADRMAVMKDGVISQLGTPLDIYNKPANSFVAAFLGAPPMNFVNGRVEREGNELFFRADADRLELSSYIFREELASFGSCVLGLRPEHIRIDQGALQPGQIHARVKAVERLGPDAVILASCFGTTVVIRGPADLNPELGGQINLSINLARISLFDANSGVRI